MSPFEPLALILQDACHAIPLQAQEKQSLKDSTSSQEAEIQSHLPLDILRDIFELAALQSRHRPLELMLISKLIKSWVEPIFYQYMWFHGKQLSQFHMAFYKHSHQRTTSSYDPTRVRTLILSPYRYQRVELEQIVLQLTNVRTLDLVGCLDSTGVSILVDSCRASTEDLVSPPGPAVGQVASLDSYPFKNLRELSVRGYDLQEIHITSFSHRIFRDLTHISIAYDQGLDWTSLQHLHNLTHLRVSVHWGADTPPGLLERWILTTLGNLPQGLRVMLFDITLVLKCRDFDLRDRDGDIFPVGWFPTDLEGTLQREGESPGCLQFTDEEIDKLHVFSRMALGRLDPRAVLQSSASHLYDNNIFCDLIVHADYPTGTWWETWPNAPGLLCWAAAEDIIEKRKSIGYHDLITRLLQNSERAL